MRYVNKFVIKLCFHKTNKNYFVKTNYDENPYTNSLNISNYETLFKEYHLLIMMLI